MKSLKNIKSDELDVDLNDKTYDAQINRTNPTSIIMLIDQSTSMKWNTIEYKGEEKNYSEIVADMVNQTLNELIGRCTKSEGVRNYFDICVLGYGGKSAHTANILWEGSLEGKSWVSISELKENANYQNKTITRVIRGKEKTSEIKVPYWFKAVANYKTPMGDAFSQAYQLLKDWINEHQASYPPVLINITDGMQSDMTDIEMISISNKIQQLNTKDGNVLVLNCHVSNSVGEVIFPVSLKELPSNEYSETLFKMSSVMPKSYNASISNLRSDTEPIEDYKGMAYNASMDALFNIIDIGTSGATQQLNKQ